MKCSYLSGSPFTTRALNSVSDIFSPASVSRDTNSCARIKYSDSFSFSSNCNREICRTKLTAVGFSTLEYLCCSRRHAFAPSPTPFDDRQTCRMYKRLHSKNVRVKNSGSFENDPIWVKTASFNPVMGHIWIKFRTKRLTGNSGSREKARWRCMERAGNRLRPISSKLFTV